MLNVTKANVWASMVAGRSRLAMTKGMRAVESSSWGRKARDSARGRRMGAEAEAAEDDEEEAFSAEAR